MEGAADVERPCVVVEVRPHEAADLAQSEAGGQFSVEEIVPDGVGFDGFHKSIQLFFVQDVHGLADHLGRFHLIGRVGGDKPLFHRRPVFTIRFARRPP